MSPEARGLEADFTVLPLWAVGPVDQHKKQPHHYWPFIIARGRVPDFLKNPKILLAS